MYGCRRAERAEVKGILRREQPQVLATGAFCKDRRRAAHRVWVATGRVGYPERLQGLSPPKIADPIGRVGTGLRGNTKSCQGQKENRLLNFPFPRCFSPELLTPLWSPVTMQKYI